MQCRRIDRPNLTHPPISERGLASVKGQDSIGVRQYLHWLEGLASNPWLTNLAILRRMLFLVKILTRTSKPKNFSMALSDVLERVANLTIDGWYDFQTIDGEIWGFTGHDVIPRRVPRQVASAYKTALREAQRQVDALQHQQYQAEIAAKRSDLETQAQQLRAIALPPGCYICPYLVKRKGYVYEYMKLWHHQPIFNSRGTPRQRQYWIDQGKKNLEVGKVRNRHLGKADSEAHRQAIAGIKACKELEKVMRQLSVLSCSTST